MVKGMGNKKEQLLSTALVKRPLHCFRCLQIADTAIQHLGKQLELRPIIVKEQPLGDLRLPADPVGGRPLEAPNPELLQSGI